ncbi:hypothetical protein, partial [Burkholderia ubonensis]|uniref:hypothetical protein n=1 Tax=Burkholderia ubonensis TaxID=101571 RepID=UPI001E5955D5
DALHAGLRRVRFAEVNKLQSRLPATLRETLINMRSREVVGDVGGEWPDTEAKRRPFREVCPEDAPYFSHFSHA